MSTTAIKIGYSMPLTGALAANGQTALLAQTIWKDDINRRGGLLGRPVELLCRDDQTNASLVPGIYQNLLDVDKVDLVIGGYGNNSLTPAMHLVIDRNRYFLGLMGLGVNKAFNYRNYFVMIPTGPQPNTALTQGFFEVAARQRPRPETVGILAADADFTRNPIAGAHENARAYGLRVVSERKYPLTTQDFAPIIREFKSEVPDVLFLCSYLSDSVGLIRAINDVGIAPKVVGGAMIGPQSSSVMSSLGPLLNGLINYEYWLPVPKMMYPGVADFVQRYQEKAKTSANADALGFYVAPMAFAQMQVLEQSIAGTGSLDDAALAEYTRNSVFKTIVGDVKFGADGEWSAPRVLQVQFRNIDGHGVDQFKDARTRAVVSPIELASADLIYPYAKAKT
jgi:branched-chain amino acid transport system substrate-binding protein